MKSFSRVQLFVTPTTLVGQTSPALGFSRQEYWTGLPFPSPGHLPDFLVAQRVKRLSTMRETQVRSLGREDPLEEEMAIHSSIIAWKIPWTEEPGRLQSMGSQRVGHD